MKKEFDFDDIGKKTPYRVPEGFFDEMQRNVRKHTYGGKPAGNCTAAAPADKWIREMSDEELEELVSFSESDIFLN